MTSDAATTETLAVVDAFVTELGTRPPAGVGLDDHLERDLGVGSLERVELLSRLEHAFALHLPDEALAEAETPRDLARMVVEGGGAPAPEAAAAPLPGPAGAAPRQARTLVEALRQHVEATPDRAHVVLRADAGAEQVITYGALWEASCRVAAALREHGIGPGASVALMLRTEEAFFSTFFGTLLAGAVPVPIYPPHRPDRLEEYAQRQLRILENAEAQLLVTFAGAQRVARLLRPRLPRLRGVVEAGTFSRASPARPDGQPPGSPDIALRGDHLALIQYTSGSTGEPKGVPLSHANLLANIRAIGEALQIGPGDVGVSWLPLYHDMGLIGAWLGSLYHGIPVVILSPLAFLARPSRWLLAIHGHRATLSPAPNFAFDLCVKRIADDEIQGLDLSSWRLALNGSEPVSVETIERFRRRFVPFGFQPSAMCPVYGLAECAVGLTVTPPGRGPGVDVVDRERFQRDRLAVTSPPGEATPLRFVSCGIALPGHEVRVVDAAGHPAGERREGGVQFRGPSVTQGYFRNVVATRAVIADGWMDSGDLGYLAGGELYITGRRKDLIIRGGRNLYPQEIEEVAGDVPGVRRGCVAAFGTMDPGIGTERLIVVAETRQTGAQAHEALRRAILESVLAATGVPADTIVVAPPGTVLKTSSGKVRRSATRDAYLRGALARRAPARLQAARLVMAGVAASGRRALGGLGRVVFAARAGLALALTMPPLWLVLRVLGNAGTVDAIVRRWCRLVLGLAGCHVRARGLDRLPSTGPAVLVANHSSYLDAVVLLAAIPAPFRFVAKRELAVAPLVGDVIRKVGHLTVERVDVTRSVADAERVAGALGAGTWLLFFPEGTFVRAPGLLPFRLGAFRAAVEARCPVVPIGIQGTREILPAGTWVPAPGDVTVSVGVPLLPTGERWRDILRLRDEAARAIARALDDASATAAEDAGAAPPAPGAPIAPPALPGSRVQ